MTKMGPKGNLRKKESPSKNVAGAANGRKNRPDLRRKKKKACWEKG